MFWNLHLKLDKLWVSNRLIESMLKSVLTNQEEIMSKQEELQAKVDETAVVLDAIKAGVEADKANDQAVLAELEALKAALGDSVVDLAPLESLLSKSREIHALLGDAADPEAPTPAPEDFPQTGDVELPAEEPAVEAPVEPVDPAPVAETEAPQESPSETEGNSPS